VTQYLTVLVESTCVLERNLHLWMLVNQPWWRSGESVEFDLLHWLWWRNIHTQY